MQYCSSCMKSLLQLIGFGFICLLECLVWHGNGSWFGSYWCYSCWLSPSGLMSYPIHFGSVLWAVLRHSLLILGMFLSIGFSLRPLSCRLYLCHCHVAIFISLSYSFLHFGTFLLDGFSKANNCSFWFVHCRTWWG